MNITSSIDPRDINPYPWWDHRSPFYVGDILNPPYEPSTTGGKNITYYDLSGKNVTPKEKSVITKDALAIALVTEGNEFLMLASVPVGTAETINAVKHFFGLRYPMPDNVEAELEDVLYNDATDKVVTWKVGDSLFAFTRTTLIMED